MDIEHPPILEANRSLIFAAGAGDAERALSALKQGADIECLDAHGSTALSIACVKAFEKCAAQLIQAGASLAARSAPMGRTPLMDACAAASLPCLRLLVDAGADLEARDSLGWNAAIVCSGNGNIEGLRILIAAGAGLEARSATGRSGAMIAAMLGSLDCLAILIDAGADLLATDHRGDDALSLARSEEEDPCARMLLGALCSAEALSINEGAPCQGLHTGAQNPL